VAHELRKAGWSRAYAFVGGWQAWLDAGLPVAPRAADEEEATHLST
jgi:3-mercaptopyruvate sulfurtransferase SseA